MKLHIERYNEEWPNFFLKFKKELLLLLQESNAVIEHFGSTAVPGLSAKPVIDILVGIENKNLLSQMSRLILQNKFYVYFKVWDEILPERRPFVRLKDEVDHLGINCILEDLKTIPHDKINEARLAHVHIWEYNSSDWIRHIAFRDYLIAH